MTDLINTNLETLTAAELKTLAKEFKVKNWWNLKKTDLITELTNIKLNLEDQAAIQKANEEYREELEKTESQETKSTEEKTSKESSKSKAKKTKAPKVEKNEENLVTLKELAAEFHMKGTKARRLLRGETAARPFGGNRWEWDKDLHKAELELARSILKAHTK